MTIISVKGGNSQEILDGSQDTLSLLAITTGTGLVHVGDPSPDGFDVPFRGGDRIILPANEPATLRADGFVVTGSIGAYGGQTYSGGGTPEPFWQPFTITLGDDGNGNMGYARDGTGAYPPTGSLSNQPVVGAVVDLIFNVGENGLEIQMSSETVLLNNITTASQIGIGSTTYSPMDVTFGQSGNEGTLSIYIDAGDFNWTVGQQVPIVIIP